MKTIADTDPDSRLFKDPDTGKMIKFTGKILVITNKNQNALMKAAGLMMNRCFMTIAPLSISAAGMPPRAMRAWVVWYRYAIGWTLWYDCPRQSWIF